ncbi:hypothetical protein WJX84_004663 [Apatococcus fuscideae]|uniref:Uncharacterized protein n=1 Tax=Apatococcus fuscideae TaxID=2026836 RepID=A0AAW1SNK9_9CHLO
MSDTGIAGPVLAALATTQGLRSSPQASTSCPSTATVPFVKEIAQDVKTNSFSGRRRTETRSARRTF